MAKVTTVKRARKDYPEFGIKIGDTYYQWGFRNGPVFKSKTYPKPSQLTQSDFLQRVYAINERLESFSPDIEDIESEGVDIVNELEELRDECEEKRSNMPEHLQDVGSGEILQNRYDALDELINDLGNIDLDFGEEIEEIDDDATEIMKEEHQEAIDEREEKYTSALEEIRALSYQGE